MINKIDRIKELENEINDLPSVINSIYKRIIENEKDVKRCFEKINTLNDKINESIKDISLSRINSSIEIDNKIDTLLSRINSTEIEIDNKINTLNKKIEGVEILFNNINEINYINKTTESEKIK